MAAATIESLVFSRDQVEAYFDRLALPGRHRKFSVAALPPADALAHLGVLQRYHLQAVPFENLSLHYSQHRTISTNLDALFKKIVLTPGRGGYCMENNRIFGTLLRSLGYQLYSAGGRVLEDNVYTAWSHMVNLVTIDGTKYLVDVGFGGNCSIQPIPLIRQGEENSSPAVHHILPASARLIYKNIESNSDPNQRLWVYQYRLNDAAGWGDVYCFTELEFLPNDYALVNYYTSTSPASWFTQRVVVMRFLLGNGQGQGGDQGEEVIGVVILSEGFKRRVHGEVTERQELKTEQDRLQVLDTHFGIKFADNERDGIKGLASEIRSHRAGP